MPDLTQKEAAERLAITPSWLRKLTKRGAVKRNSDRSYPWPQVRDQLRAFQRAGEEDRSAGFGDEGYEVARARKVAAQASLAELELLVREGELISVGAHRAVLDKVIEMFRAALLSVPGSWGPRIVGIKSPAEGTEAMRLCCEELLQDLASAAGQLSAQDTT